MSKNLETGGEALGLVCSLGLLARKGPYKVLAVLLFATVAAMGCAGPLHAKPPLQGPEITLTIADAATGLPDSEGEADERVTMRVSADGTEEMAGIQFKVGFDSSVVQVATDGVVQGELPQGILFESNVDNTAGSVSIITASATAADVSSLTIADITFSLVGSPGESSPLTFTEVVASDGAVPPQAIPVVPVDGSLSVRTPNQPPVAMDDTATTKEVAPVNIDVLANDSDPDAGDTLTVVSTTVPANGSVAIEADSTITYTPDPRDGRNSVQGRVRQFGGAGRHRRHSPG